MFLPAGRIFVPPGRVALLAPVLAVLVPYDGAAPGRDWALECFVVTTFSRLLVWPSSACLGCLLTLQELGLAYARDRSTSSLHWLVRHSAAIFGVWVCLLVCSPGACTGRRGWLSPLPGTAFRRWVLWVPPVSPPALARSAFVVRLPLASCIAQWEEIEKLPFSIALSAFKL